MTEDEAFIRAIVDAPGDDAARLVYADWLDDRSDPRGAYLRAELKSVGRVTRKIRQGDLTRLSKLRVDIDPIWLARVTRPPMGVCCDRIKFIEPGPRISREDIVAVLGDFAYPPDYIAFLLNYNGGWPEPAMVRPRQGYHWEMEWFNRLDEFRALEPTVCPSELGIGHTHSTRKPVGGLSIHVTGKWANSVWIGYTDNTETGGLDEYEDQLAPSFSYLLSMIS